MRHPNTLPRENTATVFKRAFTQLVEDVIAHIATQWAVAVPTPHADDQCSVWWLSIRVAIRRAVALIDVCTIMLLVMVVVASLAYPVTLFVLGVGACVAMVAG
jgi:hypothetical protein